MMPEPSRSMSAVRKAWLVVLATTTLAVAGGASAAAARKPVTATAGKSEPELLKAADRALEAGDCRAATDNYVAAAQVTKDVQVMRRATQLALGCDQPEAARIAAALWRAKDRSSGDAALAAALVALKRYDLPGASAALKDWRDSGIGAHQDPLEFAQLLEEEADITAVYRVFGDVLVTEESAAEVLLAHARLAFAAQNMDVAVAAAKGALAIEPGMVEAEALRLRAISIKGDHAGAIAGARALDASRLAGEDVFLLADLLGAADRSEDAQAELQRLGARPEFRQGAARRLFSLAMRDGRLDAAERQLGAMAGDGGGGTALALLYLAQLSERRGNDEEAMQAYRLLADSPLGLTARASAARLMIENGERKAAMEVLDQYVAENRGAALEVGSTRVHLLSDAGEVGAALEVLDGLEEQYPGHPDLAYQRATVLEAGGRTRASIAQLEQALKARPDDPQLQNALGYTLADHKQQLPRAEQLVRAALAASPDNPAIQDSLGWVLFQRGKAKAALPVLERAWQNSGDSEIAAHYGEVLWRDGDQAQARYVWQQALNGDPDHQRLRNTMKRLTGEDVATP